MSQYSLLAPHYRNISEQRKRYIDAVDSLILSHSPNPVSSVLDVGAGDGVRGLNLARALRAGIVTLCEPCAEMAGLCRKNASAFPGADVLECEALALATLSVRYSVILCLWNVLGHVSCTAERVRVLIILRQHLAAGGVIFLDVNNRHNASAYGASRVWWRRIADALLFDEKKGDATYVTHVDGANVSSMGHLFIPKEMNRLFFESDLSVRRCWAVDYRSGAISFDPGRGQLCYALEATR